MFLYFRYSGFFFSLILLLLTSCGEEPSVQPAAKTEKNEVTTEEKKERRFMRPQTSYLRIRATPDQEAEVLETLPPDVLLEYLHDSTSFMTSVSYRNKQYEAHWYKVRSPRTAEGWIFGGLVSFVGEIENRALAKEAEARELLTANNQAADLSKKEKKEAKEIVYESALQSYENYINQLSPSNINSVGIALEQFKIRFADKSNTKTCDAAYIAFSALHDKVMKQISLRSLGAYQNIATDLKHYQTVNMDQDAFTQQLEANAIRFALEEGKLVLKKDLDAVFRVFFRECSSIMRAYMGQQELDENTYWKENGALLITPLEMARWVLSWNYFVAKNEGFVWYGDAQAYLKTDLTVLLKGTENTPVFDEEQLLKADFKKAYEYITKNYPSSNIGKQFIDYMNLLELNEWKESSSTQNKVKEIINTLVN
jgi:hypothetical protein